MMNLLSPARWGKRAADTKDPSPGKKRSKAANPGSSDDADALGRIFVAVRIRPLNARELSGDDGKQPEVAVFRAMDGNKVVEQPRYQLPEGAAAPAWEADAVFGEGDGNANVYSAAAKPVVSAVLRGINGTVMAYGQTSSGKTHTMSGSDVDPGVMSLALRDIFDAVRADEHTRRYDVRCSYMEIYNEEIRDLLSRDPDGNRSHIKLVNGHNGLTQVLNLEERKVKSSEEVNDVVAAGLKRRQVGRTAMNHVSSRSHAVLRIKVASAPLIEGDPNVRPATVSTLYVVDLAGSERAAQNTSKATKKEGAAINQSLLTLRLCVQRLAKDAEEGTETHVPYRDSKLTRILQPALAGPGRTAIVAAVTPAAGNAQETYSTLNFVGTAKSVKMDAKVNVVNAGSGANLTSEERKVLSDLRANAAAEAIRRKELEEEHERAQEELSRVGAGLAEAEAKVTELTRATEVARRREEDTDRRVRELEQRAEEAERARDVASEKLLEFAGSLADRKTGDEARIEELTSALEAARREAATATAAAKAQETASAAAANAATAARLQVRITKTQGGHEAVAKAEAQAEAARNAEKAALKAAGRELERASREKAEAVAELERKSSEQKGRIAALEASLGRSRERLEKAKEMLGEAAKYKERAKSAERSLAEERARFISAEKEALGALQAEERRHAKAAADLADAKARLAREQRECAAAKDALTLERNAGKELEEAATTAMVEVERLSGECDGMRKALASANEQIATLRDEKSGAALSKEHAAVMDDQLHMIGALEKELGDATSATAHAQMRAEDAEKKNAAIAAENAELKALLEDAVDRLPSSPDGFDVAGAEAEIKSLRDELRAAEERAAVQLAASRSAARAGGGGGVAAAAKCEELAADLLTAARELEHEKEEHRHALEDAKDETDNAANEAKMLRETNEELLGFMSELESASMDTAREGEAMAAQIEALKRELRDARLALGRVANNQPAVPSVEHEEKTHEHEEKLPEPEEELPEPAALDIVEEEEEEEEEEPEEEQPAPAKKKEPTLKETTAKKKEPTLKETKAKRASQSKPGKGKGPPPAKSSGAAKEVVDAVIDDKENGAGNGAFSVSALIASAGEWKPKTAKAAGGRRRQLGKQSAIRDSSVHENVLR
jgi:centromeric protein E